MKRVIRLTESDLVRIVKRVINEQGVEGTSLSAKDYFILQTPKGNINLTDNKGNKVLWTVTPTLATKTATTGEDKNVPGSYKLTISAKDYPNTTATATFDCSDKFVDFSPTNFNGRYENLRLNFDGKTYENEMVSKGLKNLFTGGVAPLDFKPDSFLSYYVNSACKRS